MSEAIDSLTAAIAEVDQQNAQDPRVSTVEGEGRAHELVYADALERWMLVLVPEPSRALRFAPRAQHVRRWDMPRSNLPEGRKGYLAWRRKLQDHHVQIARGILERHGLLDELGERVEVILRKRGLDRNVEVQAMEDALCLVTLERQLGELGRKLSRDKLVDVLRKTWAKMSPAGREQALTIPFEEEARALLADATAG